MRSMSLVLHLHAIQILLTSAGLHVLSPAIRQIVSQIIPCLQCIAELLVLLLHPQRPSYFPAT